MFWDRFFDLCVKAGTKPNPVGKKIGIASGTISQWKQGVQPSTEKVQVIAEYFNVSADYLLGNTDNPQSIRADMDSQLSEALQIYTKLPSDKKKLALKLLKSLMDDE